MSAVVTARALRAQYGARVVLREIDLDVSEGVTALLGPNGAGKTTLLHTFCGLRSPSSGSVSVLGTDPTRRNGRRTLAGQVGFLPQHFGFYPRFRLREFIAYAGWLKEVPRPDLAERVQHALACVDLLGRQDERMRNLSGGMLRRAGIAAAIVHQPRLLLLDEPSVGLDPAQRVELRMLIQNLGATTSVLLSTHLLDDVAAACDTVLVLNEGQLMFTGSAAQLAACAGGDEPEVEQGYLALMSSMQREMTA